MRESRTLSVSIARDWKHVYEAIWRPLDFPRWASGLSQSSLQPGEAGWWNAQGPEGPIKIRFSDHNPYGVMDHYVALEDGSIVYAAMRVIANAEGAEVLFTLFRRPQMSDEQFAADADWAARDLSALKTLLESSD